ncbi:MAG: hypothetical protein ABI954_02490 [Pyrinomonadaceae bacterium]
MMCPFCHRKLSFWRFQCRVCRRFVWRVPQILIAGIVVLSTLAGLIWLVEYLATRG